MITKPPECQGCSLYETGGNFVPPDGNGSSGIMLMGEAPGADEDLQLKPFVGSAGKLLNFVLRKGKIQRENLVITNTIQCRPPHNETPEPRAIRHCEVHRKRIIAEFQPKVIVALGDTALRTLTNGEAPNITTARGYGFRSVHNIPVIATFHPAFFLHSRKDAIREQKGKSGMGGIHSLIFDIAEKTQTPLKDPRGQLICYPTPGELEIKLKEIRSDYLVIDIETSGSIGKSEEEVHIVDELSTRIVRASVGGLNGKGHIGVSFPWTDRFVSVLNNSLGQFSEFVFWNYRFDVPRLKVHGVEIPTNKIVDGMWLFHFLYPHLPYGLGNVATYFTPWPEWKSLSGAQPEYYSAMDGLVTSEVYQGIKTALKASGVERVANRHVTQLLHVLDRMSSRGLTIDQKELADFKDTLEKTVVPLEKQLSNWEPPELAIYDPPDGYKTIPPTRQIKKKCANCRSTGSIIKKFKNGKRKAQKCKACKGKGHTTELDTQGLTLLPNDRWALKKSLSAQSPKRLLAYVRYKDHRITRGGKRPSDTDNRTIGKLIQRYPTDKIYPLIREIRSLRKLLGTYGNWPIGKDGKIHTEFTLKPETQRLSSVRPNVQNIPQPDDDDPGNLRLRFRKCLTASPGNVLGAIDYSGIEAVLTGWFANDEDYIKLAKKGIHAYATARFLGEDLTPETFRKADKQRLSESHPQLYKQLKSANHGINYGEGFKKLFILNPGIFNSLADAKKMWDFIRALIPKIIIWQEQTIQMAFKENKLVNPFGGQRWFFDRDSERNEALAQQPQSTAAGIIKNAMIEIDRSTIGQFMVFQIHDELVFDIPINRAESVMQTARKIMELPVKELDGLIIGTSGKLGPNLGEMETIW